MKTVATLTTVNIGQMVYEPNVLLCLHEGIANKLIALSLVTASPTDIDAAIASRKAYIMSLWQPDDIKAGIEAKVVSYPVVDTEKYRHCRNFGSTSTPVRDI